MLIEAIITEDWWSSLSITLKKLSLLPSQSFNRFSLTESPIIGAVTRIYPIISYRYVAHYTYHLQSTHLIYLPFVFLKILHLPIQVYTSQVHSILRYGVYPIISERGTPSPTSVSMCALTIAIHLEPTLKLHVNSFLLAF